MAERRALGSDAAAELARALLRAALTLALTDADMCKELYKKGSSTHRRKIRVWQLSCALAWCVSDESLAAVEPLLWAALEQLNQPTVRQYQELFAVRMVLRFPRLLEAEVLPRVSRPNGAPTVMASYIHIAANGLLHTPDAALLSLLPRVAAAVLPWMTTHHHSLRAFSHVVAFSLLQRFPSTHAAWGTGERGPDALYLGQLQAFLSANVEVAKLREVTARQLEWPDPVAACSVRGLLLQGADGKSLEAAPLPLLERVAEFLTELRADLRCAVRADQAVIRSHDAPVGVLAGEHHHPAGGFFSGIQRKIQVPSRQEAGVGAVDGAHPARDLAPLHDAAEEEALRLALAAAEARGCGGGGAASGSAGRERQQLMVVASLIDKVPNLAGLARTAEVLQVQDFSAMA